MPRSSVVDTKPASLDETPPAVTSQFLVILIDDSAPGTPIRELLRDICLTCGKWCDIVLSMPEFGPTST
ncbi:hypothetical protein NLJ89_g1715 [Agrocybe chaxingu]|uniref:Uncharacterized protein n=1 Tax=Agrocybe chaxingu TaxID=84603 RepID=A0A9W8MZJ1_9AGAR|nr:hypothetical protein NLJ89_g1715 [Agrocybe chaxingu]